MFGDYDYEASKHRRYYELRAEKDSITLADILCAIGNNGFSNALLSCMVHSDNTFGLLDIVWNLTTDYDGQTQETKESIGKIFKSNL